MEFADPFLIALAALCVFQCTVSGGVAAYVARKKGRRGAAFFMGGLFLGPLIVLAAIGVPALPEVMEQRREAREAADRERAYEAAPAAATPRPRSSFETAVIVFGVLLFMTLVVLAFAFPLISSQ